MEKEKLVELYTKNIRICAGQLISYASKLDKNKETETIGATIEVPCSIIIRNALDLEDLFEEKKEDQ